jgi:hypothetical protein
VNKIYNDNKLRMDLELKTELMNDRKSNDIDPEECKSYASSEEEEDSMEEVSDDEDDADYDDDDHEFSSSELENDDSIESDDSPSGIMNSLLPTSFFNPISTLRRRAISSSASTSSIRESQDKNSPPRSIPASPGEEKRNTSRDKRLQSRIKTKFSRISHNFVLPLVGSRSDCYDCPCNGAISTWYDAKRCTP